MNEQEHLFYGSWAEDKQISGKSFFLIEKDFWLQHNKPGNKENWEYDTTITAESFGTS